MALRVARYITWQVTAPDAVVALSGVNYSSSTQQWPTGPELR